MGFPGLSILQVYVRVSYRSVQSSDELYLSHAGTPSVSVLPLTPQQHTATHNATLMLPRISSTIHIRTQNELY
jgi:hypothetical protein